MTLHIYMYEGPEDDFDTGLPTPCPACHQVVDLSAMRISSREQLVCQACWAKESAGDSARRDEAHPYEIH